ncbi:hypothetical protein [Paenarthrobacter sp. NPDC018779]|uniref:hypothetical protein n=1 Tax=Paenarthrobacter sp. NPDC018779 TaxID=3364375 RepID=UPI0037CBC8A7
MSPRQDTDTLLQSLDPANAGQIDAHRSRSDLVRILSTDPLEAHVQSSPKKRTYRRLAVLGGAVAVVTAGLLVLPGMTGGDEAFATWTAVPSGMSAKERHDVAEQCRASNKDVGGGMYRDDLATAKVAISERRGAWTTVVLAGQGGFSALCITDDSFHLFGKSRMGSIGGPANAAPLGPRDLRSMALGTGTMGAGDISLAAGEAGSAVVGMTYQSKTQGDVAATVSLGRFALWLPGEELRNASSEGMDVLVTYDDGTTGVRTLSFEE